ncbi:MAG: VCBS repeat-containing protein, partial [Bacteroidota bacterium]
MMPRFAAPAILCALVLMAGCSGVRPAPPTPSAATPVLPDTLVRSATPFTVVDAAGEAYTFPFLGGYNLPRPRFADIDADGDLDLFVQETTGQVSFFERQDDGFVWRTDQFQGLNIGEWYQFADLDGDQDLDLLAEQQYSYIQIFRNDGTPQVPRFTEIADSLRNVDGAPIFSDRQNIPSITDLDCNGQLDLFLGRVDGTLVRYEEATQGPDGLPRFRLVNERFEGIEIVAQIGEPGTMHGANAMAFGDIDSDGDLDLFWGDFFEPGVLLIENTGTSCAAFSLRGDPVPFPPDNPVGTSGYNAPSLADVDSDGDIDLFFGVLGGAFDPNTSTIENFYFVEHTDGLTFTTQTRRFVYALDRGSEAIPTTGDLDGDGDLDLLIGNKIEPGDPDAGRLIYFENTGTATAPAYAQRDPMPVSAAYHYAPALGDLDAD